MAQKVLLTIDDDASVQSAVRLAFERDFTVYTASNKQEALQEAVLRSPDVILLDLDFNGEPEGWEILEDLRKNGCEALILILSAYHLGERDLRGRAADGFFDKMAGFFPVMEHLRKNGLMPLCEP